MSIQRTLSFCLPIATISLWGLSLAPLRAEEIRETVNNIHLPSLVALEYQDGSYDEYMRLGYAAMQREDYYRAAIYFRYALYFNPKDRQATIAYWNARDGADGTDSQSAYDRYMEQGYDATDAENYTTALASFQQALAERPGDYYAAQAIRNIRTYINRGEGTASSEVANDVPNFYYGEQPYDRYMRLGYAAMQREDYTIASRYFRDALYQRPGDRQANTAYWQARDGVRNGIRESESATGESAYDRDMRRGYDATETGNYRQAIFHFQQALKHRPGDEYAQDALENVRTYLRRGENLSFD